MQQIVVVLARIHQVGYLEPYPTAISPKQSVVPLLHLPLVLSVDSRPAAGVEASALSAADVDVLLLAL